LFRVAVPAAVPLLDDAAGVGEIGDDAAGAALSDAQADRDVAQAQANFAWQILEIVC
jgi:hypothetical protein